MGTEFPHTSTIEAANAFTTHMAQMQEEGKAALSHTADKMAWYYDQHCQQAPHFQVGEQVWLNTQNYSTDCLMKKLDHWWISPFKILKVVSPVALKLQLTPKEKGVHPVVSVSNICHYTPNDIPK